MQVLTTAPHSPPFTTGKLDSSKARAAGALWSMSSTSHQAVVAAGSIESYALLDGLLMAS